MRGRWLIVEKWHCLCIIEKLVPGVLFTQWEIFINNKKKILEVFKFFFYFFHFEKNKLISHWVIINYESWFEKNKNKAIVQPFILKSQSFMLHYTSLCHIQKNISNECSIRYRPIKMIFYVGKTFYEMQTSIAFEREIAQSAKCFIRMLI
jgi:hypothetical protein